jgi:hypothetical protein
MILLGFATTSGRPGQETFKFSVSYFCDFAAFFAILELFNL